MDGAIPVWASQLGVIPLTVIFAWLMLSGRIHSDKAVQRLLDQADKVIASKQETIDTLLKQNQALLASGKATIHTIESVREAAVIVHTDESDDKAGT